MCTIVNPRYRLNLVGWNPRTPVQKAYTTPDGFYVIDGERYPRVTAIIKDTVDRPGLDAWKKRVGAEQAVKIAHDASVWGDRLHDLLEYFALDHELPADDDPFMPWIQLYAGWFNKNVVEVLSAERLVWSKKYCYAGTLDCLIINREGEVVLVDYKTVNRPFPKPDHQLQTGAYALALWEEGLRVDRRIVLQFPRGNAKDFTMFEHRDHRQDILQFIEHVKLWEELRNGANQSPSVGPEQT